MPTDQPNTPPHATERPSNAPNDLPGTDAADRDTAAGVVADPDLDAQPGGGGLGGRAAADPLGGSARTPSGTAPNAPIDVHAPDAPSTAQAEAEARVRASQADAPEPHPRSQ